MIVTERDKICAKTLVELLNKAQLSLVGSEVVVAGRVMEWSAELLKRIDLDLKPQSIQPVKNEPIDLVTPTPVKKTKKAH